MDQRAVKRLFVCSRDVISFEHSKMWKDENIRWRLKLHYYMVDDAVLLYASELKITEDAGKMLEVVVVS